MQIPLTYLQKCKVVAHVFQAIFIFVAGCITLAIFTKDGSTDGRSQFYFALCFITVPALIYQTMVPMWSRTVRFANAYAFLSLDALFTIFWFAAFIGVLTWNASGKRQEAEKEKFPSNWPRNCSHFAFGPAAKCELSQAAAGIGSVVFIFFCLTTAMSTYIFLQYRKTGELPTAKPQYAAAHNPDNELEGGQKDNTWSSSTREADDPFAHEDDDYLHDNLDRSGYSRTHHDDDENEHTALNSEDTEYGRHPGQRADWDSTVGSGVSRHDTEYYRSHTPSALSPGGYEDTEYHSQPVENAGNRKPVGSGRGRNYSFSNGD